ncbi:MAG: hypothetical protein A2W05_03930 [Candidatus Schekmanbacteria bacterium RBG_16_38_10]|uniref:Uncharacterized protein n=1 Tax=Candidatus Schekmanbacteria bacterium RBG_16_38_10 TaxID=1817879 RepID=A0A1F7RUP1_9BACT|nr:MAG: hypothetical protein A2W05_03930 [Candidatus Schekmanbacteria bacterium RBG_16_38_10]
MNKIIPEQIVLIETAKWFVKRGCDLNSISIPRGKGYTGDIKSNLENELKDIGYDKKINYNPHGADIIAQNEDEIWKVECKGLGSGTTQTLRNNFDRALASAVTYFDEEDKQQFLVLAIPNSLPYLQQLLRINKSLRKTLNLWILLIDENDHTVNEYKPEDDIKGVMKKQKKFSTEDLIQALKNNPELRDYAKSLIDNNKI